MNEYTITLTVDDPASPPSTIVLQQDMVDRLLNEFALPAAVSASENPSARTQILGVLEVSNDAEPIWNGETVEQDVFANMLGDAIVLAAIRSAEAILGSQQPSGEGPGADN